MKLKVCYVRSVEIRGDVEEYDDGVKRSIFVTDKNGEVLEISLRGDKRSDLLIEGLKQD